MDAIQEKAREVGRLLAQTSEYQALKRANDRLEEDREAAPLLGRLA
ncbi:MAG: YlbF family regulator, partial [Gemmatimonadetes bacterium]|nr:YlbF family regulator [Gemmatimonadota bacterium]